MGISLQSVVLLEQKWGKYLPLYRAQFHRGDESSDKEGTNTFFFVAFFAFFIRGWPFSFYSVIQDDAHNEKLLMKIEILYLVSIKRTKI